MFSKMFVDHPKSVNESYAEHWYVANRFGLLMLKAGLAAVIHGFVPGLFTRTGSDVIRKLHGEMENRIPGHQPDGRITKASAWQLEYEI